MLLTRKSEQASAAGPRLRRLVGGRYPTMDRRTFLKRSGLVAGTGAFASQLPLGAIGTAEAQQEGAAAKGEVKRTICTHCSVGCADRRHRRERRVDAAEPGVRVAAQPGRALRQGRLGARARPRRIPAQGADEARQRQVPEDQLGAGDQRGRRQAARAAQGIGPRRGVLGRQLQAQQRAGVPRAQVRVVLGHEQLRPPGAHLPLDDGRRRSQHLGLRRDDQLVQRHAERQVRCCTSARTRPRRTRCRCCTCCTPRRPAR